MADGSRHSLYWVEEGVGKVNYAKTPATPAFDTARTTGVTLGLSKDPLQSEEIRSDRQISDFRLGANQVGGDLSFELSYGTFDKILESALQGEWTADVLKIGTTRRSFSMLRHFADLDAGSDNWFLYKGIEASTLNLNFAANAMVTGTVSVLGSSQELSNSAPTDSTFLPTTTTPAMDGFTGSILEGDSPIAVVTEATLTLENGLGARFVVGNKDSIYPEVGTANLTGQVTAYFEDSSLVKKFIDETRSSLKITTVDALGNQYEFVFHNIVYTGGQPDVSGPGSIMLTMPFQAILDDTAGTNFTVTRTPV